VRESDIEQYLVRRVEDIGGEVRKVQWIARRGAPDRLVMIPDWYRLQSLPAVRPPIWVELKAPGLAATFPADERERAQHREHERMRKLGQHVVVIDSKKGVDDLLA
jgi:hypothetical protein